MEHVYCESCGRIVPRARIAALPYTKTCVLCSQERPLTEDDLQLDTSDSEDLLHMVQNTREQS